MTATHLSGGPLPWVLAAAAVVLAPNSWWRGVRASTRPRVRGRPRHGRSPAPPPDRLPLIAAVAVTTLAVAVLGWPLGGVLASVAGPAAARAVRAARHRSRAQAPGASLALALDLAAAAMRAGSPLPEALALAAPAAGDHAGALDQVGVLLRLGAEPAAAWGTVEADPLGQLARTAVRSAESGVRLAAALEASAQQLRAEFQTSARMRAERTGVLALAPLGLCFLPAFVCLGIVPVVVGIARDVSVALP